MPDDMIASHADLLNVSNLDESAVNQSMQIEIVEPNSPETIQKEAEDELSRLASEQPQVIGSPLGSMDSRNSDAKALMRANLRAKSEATKVPEIKSKRSESNVTVVRNDE